MKINLLRKEVKTHRGISFKIISLIVILAIGFWYFLSPANLNQETKITGNDLVAQGQQVTWINTIQTLIKDSNIPFIEQISQQFDKGVSLQEPVITLLFLLVIWKLVISLRRQLERQTTNRRLAEHALQEKDQQYNRLLSQLSQYFIYKRDNQGQFSTVSQSIKNILGCDASRFQNDLSRYLTNNPINQGFLEHFKEIEDISMECKCEVEMLDDSGDLHWIELTEIAIKDENGKIILWEGIGRDITDIRNTQDKLEQAKSLAEHANQMKSDFLANMSHEIRTPMNAIMGMSYLALKTDLTDQQRDYIDKIKNASDGLLGIINDILDFSKIEAGKLTMEKVNFDLHEVIDNLVNLCSTKLNEKGLQLIINKPTSIPNLLVGDPLRLGQVLINLVSNAIKFTQQGEIVITIECLKQTGEQVELGFSVRDTGIGISTEQANNLFQSFSQADTSITRKYGGTGLGLAISKQLVELMQGEIQVQSTLGVGSSFIFNAKFNIGQEQSSPKLQAFDKTLKGIKILIVDDNQTARDLITAMLDNYTVNTHCVSSGNLAIDEVRVAESKGAPYDLLLMDWKTPKKYGLETIKRIRADDQIKNLPILILVSMDERQELLQISRHIKIDGIITKPINFSKLIDGILNTIGKLAEQPKPAKPTINTHTEQNKLFTKKTILLVEDNSINQQVAREMLEELKLSVVIVDNGLEAVEAVQDRSFDLVLMDLQMPKMDGFQATKEIRKLPQFNNLPIIAMTAHALSTDREKCLAIGMNDHLAKPIEPEVLIRVLANWLDDNIEISAADGDQIKARKDEKHLLPDVLPGIEQTEGLKKLRCNYGLYHKLLKEFYEDHQETANKIQVFLQEQNNLGARQLIHTIIGVAGNLGAVELFESATNLQRALVNKSDYKEPLAQFIETCNVVMLGLAGLFKVEKIQPQVSPPKNIDYQEINQQIQLLKQDLESHCFQSSERIVHLHELLGDNYAEIYQKLEKNVDSFLFRNALECLDELSKKINEEIHEVG